MDPLLETTYGLHENVAVFDFKSLYPSMMAANNISWECITEEDNANHIYFQTPKNLRAFDREKVLPSVSFTKEPLGVLPQTVIKLMEMRDSYKKNLKEASTDEEKRKCDSAQLATKRVVNALYGVLAYDRFGWGNMKMAAAITASARYAMRSAAFKAQELGYKVNFNINKSYGNIYIKKIEN